MSRRMRRAVVVAFVLGAVAGWACGAFGPAEAEDGAPGAGGPVAGEPHIVMRVRLSARSPVRFALEQDAAAMALSDEVVARDTTLGRSFTDVLGAGGAGEDAYQVEMAKFERLQDAIDLRSALGKYLSFDDTARCLPYIAPEGDGWVLRIGGTGDPATAYRVRTALAWAGMERGFMPTPIIVRPRATEQARLAPGGGPYEVRAGELPGEVLLATPSGETTSFLGRGVRITPADPLGIAFSLGGVRYRGELEIERRDSWDSKVELVAINRIDIECYVEGVLAGEVYPNWEMEAIKAQAVAARTYALYRKADSYDRGYDVDDTVSYQKYSGGHAIESFRRAVAETRGQVLTYQGGIIKAYYFASGGGVTEGDEEIWPGAGDEPYLEATEDFDQISPHYVWQSPVAAWAGDLLGRLGMRAAFPARIEPAMTSGEKILAYRFRTASDSLTLTREQVRRRLGLRSPRFTIRLVGPSETGIGAPGRAAPATPRPDGPDLPGTREKLLLPAVTACAAVRNGGITSGYRVTLGGDVFIVSGAAVGPESPGELSPETLVIIDGVGYGHGVGLSQWGAQGMALMRDDSGRPLNSYVDILEHYYRGVQVVGNYNLPVAPPADAPGGVPGVAPGDSVPGGVLPGDGVPGGTMGGDAVPDGCQPAANVSFVGQPHEAGELEAQGPSPGD